ncbi:MAG: anthranilate phosphoribosyltransferase, partial [Neobacillus sp.]|nr:anthranilate phosphoribosyltransferase [Neobacillus sp.]
GENHLTVLENGVISNQSFYPEEMGLPQYENSSIKGGNSQENAEILLKVLKGEKGAYRDTVLLNAGLGIFTSGKTGTIQEGIHLAKEVIDSGAAFEKLTLLIEKSRSGQKEAI